MEKIKIKYIILAILLTTFTGLVTSGKSGYAKLEYSQSMPHFGRAYVGKPIEVDSVDGHYHKVVFQCGPLNFQVIKKASTLEYIPILKDKKRLYTEVQEINVDSLDMWTKNNVPVFNLQITNSDGLSRNIYWYPFTLAKYNDIRFNEFPITVIDICKYNVEINGEPIDIYVDPQNKISIKTPEIKRGVRNGVSYKDAYDLADTIPLNSSFIKITSIDFEKKGINYEIIPKSKNSLWILPQQMKALGLADTQKNYYLIDFYGSWCSPCIHGLKELVNYKKELFEKYDITTIACEYSSNDYPKSKEILDSIGVDWNTKYEIIGEKYNEEFNIRYFPTYIIIRRDGLILLVSNEVKDVLNHLNNLLLSEFYRTAINNRESMII